MPMKKLALRGSERRPLPGAVATGLAPPDDVIDVTLKLRRKRALTPEAAAAAPMTREELAATYGAAEADIAKVTAAFEALGLQIQSTNQATRSVILSGTVAAMQAAFDVKLFDYASPSGAYRGRIGPVHLPAALKGVVVGVFGLDSRRVARRRRQPARDAPPAPAGAAAWRTPAQLATRYSFPPGDGAGQTVALLEFGGGYFPADLAQFCTMANIAAPPKVTVVSVDGTPTDAQDGEETEVMLDVEVVAGACPKADIVAYFAAWTEAGWLAAMDAVLQDQANDPGVLSISWGAAEDTDIWTTQAMTQMGEALNEAIALRMTVCVAAGDDGSSDGVTDGHAHVDFPGSSPLALAVGGTSIPGDGTGADIVWKLGDGLRADQGGSSGGGVSTVEPQPAWQAGLSIASVNPGAIAGRIVPDLAANADWTTSPYLLVVDGQAQGNGGTSAAAPLIAALITRINASRATAGKPRIGYLTPLLYQPSGQGAGTLGAAACADVIAGDNITAAAGGYAAAAGYDAVSGWGAPNGAALLRLLP